MTETSAPTHAAEVRRTVYRVLSSLHLYPDEERIEALRDAAPALRDDGAALRELPGFAAWDRLLERIAGLADDEAVSLAEEYTALFLSGARNRSSPPYESAHIASGPFDAGAIGAAVEIVYAEAGLAVGGAAKGELPDHVAVELDFMSWLCGKETEAAAPSEELEWRARQRSFLDEHLLRWLPSFAAGVARAVPASFYLDVARAAQEFAEHDILLIDALAEGGTAG